MKVCELRLCIPMLDFGLFDGFSLKLSILGCLLSGGAVLLVLHLDGCFFFCLQMTFLSSGLMVVAGLSSSFFFSSGQGTCVLALISCRKAVYTFSTRMEGQVINTAFSLCVVRFRGILLSQAPE